MKPFKEGSDFEAAAKVLLGENKQELDEGSNEFLKSGEFLVKWRFPRRSDFEELGQEIEDLIERIRVDTSLINLGWDRRGNAEAVFDDHDDAMKFLEEVFDNEDLWEEDPEMHFATPLGESSESEEDKELNEWNIKKYKNLMQRLAQDLDEANEEFQKYIMSLSERLPKRFDNYPRLRDAWDLMFEITDNYKKGVQTAWKKVQTFEKQSKQLKEDFNEDKEELKEAMSPEDSDNYIDREVDDLDDAILITMENIATMKTNRMSEDEINDYLNREAADLEDSIMSAIKNIEGIKEHVPSSGQTAFRRRMKRAEEMGEALVELVSQASSAGQTAFRRRLKRLDDMGEEMLEVLASIKRLF